MSNVKNCVKSILKNQYISKKIDILKNYEKDIINIDKNTCNGDNCADRERKVIGNEAEDEERN